MRITKTTFLVAAIISFAGSLNAQSLDEGKKMYYYEKYISAKKILSQIANNAEATYWLGLTDIALEDVPAAKSLYQQGLMSAPNSPLLIAGMGQIELLEGKTQDARQRFETAISLSQGKNISVLNAVGFANANTKKGDINYAIDKLKQATTLKGFKDADVYVNLGDAYRRNMDGGMAQTEYENALSINKNYARASYRIGKMYQTQGASQEDIFMKYFNDAIAKDAAYSPVYYNLYDYYYATNVGLSAQYLDKYLAAKGSDDEPNGCYYNASMKYAQRFFAQAVEEANKCIAASANPYPNLFGLKAYAYDKMQDPTNALSSFDEYFKRQKPEKIGAGDYATYSNALLKINKDSLSSSYLDKAVDKDTTEDGKISLLKDRAYYYDTLKKYQDAANWYNKLVAVKKTPTKTDFYNAGYNYFKSGNYQNSAKSFNAYSQKYSDDAFGYYMSGKANWAIDSTMSQGLANPFFKKAIEVGSADTVKYKNQLLGSYRYFVAYYANIKKDPAQAIGYCDKILALDPTDKEAASNKLGLKTIRSSAASTPKPNTKPLATKPTTTKATPKKNKK